MIGLFRLLFEHYFCPRLYSILTIIFIIFSPPFMANWISLPEEEKRLAKDREMNIHRWTIGILFNLASRRPAQSAMIEVGAMTWLLNLIQAHCYAVSCIITQKEKEKSLIGYEQAIKNFNRTKSNESINVKEEEAKKVDDAGKGNQGSQYFNYIKLLILIR